MIRKYGEPLDLIQGKAALQTDRVVDLISLSNEYHLFQV
jgi:hypothetical protein